MLLEDLLGREDHTYILSGDETYLRERYITILTSANQAWRKILTDFVCICQSDDIRSISRK